MAVVAERVQAVGYRGVVVTRVIVGLEIAPTSYMLLIASAVLLDPLDLKFGEKASAKIQGINGIHYTIFKLTADEINIYRNTNDYTLLINAEALSSINIYICNHKDYL